jgi:hypothetical protein
MTDAPTSHDLTESESMDTARRSFLSLGLRTAFGVTIAYTTSARAALCVDPEDLSSADYSFRKYVKYTESSTEPNKSCSNCMFFKSGQAECGSCQVVAGSINAHGYCTSWQARIEQR